MIGRCKSNLFSGVEILTEIDGLYYIKPYNIVNGERKTSPITTVYEETLLKYKLIGVSLQNYCTDSENKVLIDAIHFKQDSSGVLLKELNIRFRGGFTIYIRLNKDEDGHFVEVISNFDISSYGCSGTYHRTISNKSPIYLRCDKIDSYFTSDTEGFLTTSSMWYGIYSISICTSPSGKFDSIYSLVIHSNRTGSTPPTVLCESHVSKRDVVWKV